MLFLNLSRSQRGDYGSTEAVILWSRGPDMETRVRVAPKYWVRCLSLAAGGEPRSLVSSRARSCMPIGQSAGASTAQRQELPLPMAPPRLREFRCAGCGYGASCKVAPERCPMCSGSVWDYVASVFSSRDPEFDAMAPLSRDR